MLAPVVRTVRSQVLSVKEMEYIVAARAIGASAARIIGRHIMPNCLAIYLILATYYLSFAIIIEASLSFLGVGVPPDVPSWGGMLTAAAQGHVTRAPWAGIFPGLAIFIVVLGFNLLGDALRDVLEPRLRGQTGQRDCCLGDAEPAGRCLPRLPKPPFLNLRPRAPLRLHPPSLSCHGCCFLLS